MIKKASPRKQSLTPAQMYQGFMTTLDQAERLARESLVLARKRLFSGALSKAVLGLEEIGKNRLLLYQAATASMRNPVAWKAFWRTYRSHKEKLSLAMMWSSILNPDLVSKADLAAHEKIIKEAAERLDRKKQESQYVGFDGKEFAAPSDEALQEEAIFIGRVLEALCARLRRQYPVDLLEEEFSALVSEKVRLSRALGFLDAARAESRDEWAEAVVDRNSPVLVRDGLFPTLEEFQERVKERYEIVPPRLPVTLLCLNASREFELFYNYIKEKYGYPDWIIVSTIFNIALNVRVVSQLKAPPAPEKMLQWIDWTEKPDEEPLPVDHFTDEDTFNTFLDLWLLAFLTALGIKVPDVTMENRMKIRRVSSRYFSIFEYDIEHWPIFHFERAGDDTSRD